jgi:ABC-2 type transport system permease protein
MDQKNVEFYAYNSAKYEVKRDKWKNINIEIYYHKGHEYNLERMISGVKKSLEYYTSNFSPYSTCSNYGISKNTRLFSHMQIQFSFGSDSFIAAVDDANKDAVDYPLVTSHEVAHQWWHIKL